MPIIPDNTPAPNKLGGVGIQEVLSKLIMTHRRIMLPMMMGNISFERNTIITAATRAPSNLPTSAMPMPET